ncbi:DUF4158 domain-containing protein [Actinomadura welshii]|uniref:DUF4158 domain-containing protein n=1 Tax=Actinomadura welshii TaxID=3103817 RepID=UPI003B8A8189
MHPGVLDFYGKRQQTVSDHLKQVMKYLGWRTASPGTEELKELEQFLLDRAMEHDSPSLLFHLAAEYLIGARVIRPGVVTLMEMVGTARNAASPQRRQRTHLGTGRPSAGRADARRPRPAAGRRPRDRDDPAGVADPANDRGDRAVGEDRDREAEVPTADGRPRAGPVDAAARAAPLPGHRRPPLDGAGADAAGGTPLPDPAGVGGPIGGRPAGRWSSLCSTRRCRRASRGPRPRPTRSWSSGRRRARPGSC